MASAFFFDAEPVCELPSLPPTLDACALCAKPLGRDCDIFMYRGDAPFCSEECRGEQMQLDAIRPRRAAARRQQQQQQYSSRTESRHRESRKVSVAT
ncbi:unnamed protein product [Miscanthus lutarioriparius]|uniref:FLZ-type domain-containing protein n=1 Tax=Miscanthus lutarioriparius TaxID=422564 RepID=A0A811R0J6_9POAL|nr:unnamed protein product [Miscanthus lutarioriparius]